MSTQAPLQARVSSFADVQAQPNYQALTPDIQAQIAAEYFDSKIATQPAYQQAPSQAQEAMRQQFNTKYQIQSVPVHAIGDSGFGKNLLQLQSTNLQQFAQPALDVIGHSAAKTYLPFATAGKALTGDWIDLETPTLDYLRQVEPRLKVPEQLRVDAPYPATARAVAYGAGSIAPFILGEGLIKEAGTKLLPYTGELAMQRWPVASQLARQSVKGLSALQSTTLPGKMLRGAVEGAAFGGLKKLEGQNNQFDPMARLGQAAEYAAMGGVGAPVVEGLGYVAKKATPFIKKTAPLVGEALQAGVRQIQDLVNPEDSVLPSQLKGYQRQLTALYNQLWHLQEHPGLTEKEAQVVSKNLDTLRATLRENRVFRGVNKLKSKANRLEAGAEFRVKLGKMPRGEKFNAYKFLLDENGQHNLGEIPLEIAKAVKIRPGAIRIEKGSIQHIKDHDAQVQKRGFQDAVEHAKYVIKNYNAIYEGKRFQDGRKSIILGVKKEGHISYVELAPSKDYYRVNSSHPIEARRLEKKQPLWEGTRTPTTTDSGTSASYQGYATKTGTHVPSAEAQSSYSDSSTPSDTPQPPIQLKGSVKEMTESGLKGKTYEEAKTLHAQVKELGTADNDPIISKLKDEKKALGNKRDEATKEAKAKLEAKINERKAERQALRDEYSGIHQHVRELLDTDWNGKSPIANQIPVNTETQLQAEAVKHLVTESAEKKIFDQTTQAMKQGSSMRLEHRAEITGSTDAAAKVTAKGNVKIQASTFTPTHYSIVKKVVSENGEVLTGKIATEAIEAGTATEKEFLIVKGYNEAGHIRNYYINRSPEGSRIEKVIKVLDNEQYVGATPNVELGSRTFKVADVLGKAPSEEGVLTSEALKTAFAFKDLMKKETLSQFSTQTQAELKQFQKRGKFDEASFARLYKKIKETSEDMKTFCKLAGLL